MTQVCKNVGFDGNGFYCQRCGKAGFRSEASARGHLSQCKGRAIERGIPVVEREHLPVPVETFQHMPIKQVLPPAGGGVDAGTYHSFSGGGGCDGGQNTKQILSNFDSAPTTFSSDSPDWFFSMDTRLRALENEYNHLLLDRNQPQQYHSVQQDFFTQYKGLIIVGAIILFAIIMSNQSKACEGGSNSTGVTVGNLGTKALGKLVDTGITKGVAALFK